MRSNRNDGPEQLPLLAPDHVPAPFRLSERTRRIGLAGIARSRAILEEQRQRRLQSEREPLDASMPRVPGRAA